jgi:uncharacterized small protein (DUF1192 family)
MSVYTHAALRARRRSSTPVRPTTASELQLPKTVELEQRIARLELKLQRTREELDDARQRMAALQAQIDYLSARAGLL